MSMPTRRPCGRSSSLLVGAHMSSIPGVPEEPLVRAQREAVGHPGDVVGGLRDAVGVGLAEARGQVLRMIEVRGP